MSRIAVLGAGSIGCYVGGCLAAAGQAVTLIGRPRIGDTLRTRGLRVTDYLGRDQRLAAKDIDFSEEVTAAATADLVLVCVKSGATEEAGRQLAAVLPPGRVILSLQNGIGNADLLRGVLPDQQVVAGMVPFNVLNRGEGHFHQGTEGTLEAADDPALAPFTGAFKAAGLPIETHADMRAVLWAKLLLNLNNPVNALSGVPLKEELSQRAYRRCVAAAQREALALLQAAGIRPARLTPIPPRWMPRLLEVPDGLFRLLANRMLAIDPLARSSMWEDLELGRRSEVDFINGEVVSLARSLGRQAPINQRMVELIRAAEAGGRRNYSGPELWAALVASPG